MTDDRKGSGGFNPIGLCPGMGVGLCCSAALGRRGAESEAKDDAETSEDGGKEADDE